MFYSFIDKYKPKNFSEFIANEEFLNTIISFIDTNIIKFLFIGDPGTGKTTIIDCILKYYYKCDSVNYKNNILYINNLKEQGIHLLRQEVKMFIQTSSSIKDKNKFIIIDDIDSLNEQTQQILRNTIDNYNKIHIIATCNNLQNVVDNIQSRLQIFRIKSPSYNDIKHFGNKILLEENININDKQKKYIFNSSNLSYRVLLNTIQKIKLLDNNINNNFINENIENICCHIKYENLNSLIRLCKLGDIQNCLKITNYIISNGYSIIDIYESFFNYIKITDLIDNNTKYKILPIITKYISIFHTIHESNIELKFFINDLINVINI
jgi:DNA polymerase III delta prime subunit